MSRHHIDHSSRIDRQNTPCRDGCFFERDAETAILRRAGVELIGTLLLMLAIVGSGQMATRFTGASSGVNLLFAACATAGALVGLIVAFGAASGGHFNPLITLLQWVRGERDAACTVAYVAAQLLGAGGGSVLASHAFGPVPAAGPSVLPISTLFSSELLASAGLMLIVFGCSRSGRSEVGPLAVGAWLAAAIVATPSLSYANPAVAVGAYFASGPVALPGSLTPIYVIAELLGALLALPVIGFVYPGVVDVDPEAAAMEK